MIRTGFILLVAILLLPSLTRAQGLVYDTSECARLNRQLSLRTMIQEETILRQQKQIDLFTDAVVYGKYQKDFFWDEDKIKLRRSRNVLAGSTGLLLIAVGVMLIHISSK